MLLTIDVGNTNVVIGCIENGRTVSVSRMSTNPDDLASDCALKMRQSFELDHIDCTAFEGAIMSSVVPQVNSAICEAVKKLTGLDCMVVGAGLKTGINIKLDDPGTLAADLLTGAVGALSKYEPPIIVVDMGTASTIIAIDREGSYLGGAIVPGVKLSLSALCSGTSLLPSIAVEAPKKCIGTNTIDCMKSGVVFGAASMVDGMIDRMLAELGEDARLVATGGVSKEIIPYCTHDIAYEPDLILMGLQVIYDKNKKKNRR